MKKLLFYTLLCAYITTVVGCVSSKYQDTQKFQLFHMNRTYTSLLEQQGKQMKGKDGKDIPHSEVIGWDSVNKQYVTGTEIPVNHGEIKPLSSLTPKEIVNFIGKGKNVQLLYANNNLKNGKDPEANYIIIAPGDKDLYGKHPAFNSSYPQIDTSKKTKKITNDRSYGAKPIEFTTKSEKGLRPTQIILTSFYDKSKLNFWGKFTDKLGNWQNYSRLTIEDSIPKSDLTEKFNSNLGDEIFKTIEDHYNKKFHVSPAFYFNFLDKNKNATLDFGEDLVAIVVPRGETISQSGQPKDLENIAVNFGNDLENKKMFIQILDPKEKVKDISGGGSGSNGNSGNNGNNGSNAGSVSGGGNSPGPSPGGASNF